MSSDNAPKGKIDVDEIASNNPAINAPRFKEWRRKMDRLKRLGFVQDDPRGTLVPREMQRPFLVGRRRNRSGNLPG